MTLTEILEQVGSFPFNTSRTEGKYMTRFEHKLSNSHFVGIENNQVVAYLADEFNDWVLYPEVECLWDVKDKNDEWVLEPRYLTETEVAMLYTTFRKSLIYLQNQWS